MAELKLMKRNLIISGLILALSGCYHETSYMVVGNTSSLEAIQEIHAVSSSGTKPISQMRSEALQDIAMSTAAQAGLAWRSKQINNVLKDTSTTLDRVFNFNLMLMPHNVVPPVLIEGEDSLNLDNPQTIRIADRTYKIVNQAHFTTTPPTWRDYLWMSYKDPETPPAGFLPKTTEERVIWKKYATQGWEEGIAQANSIYGENLSRLKRDYTGMARYRYLLDQRMVSAPYVAHTDLGITGDDSKLTY